MTGWNEVLFRQLPLERQPRPRFELARSWKFYGLLAIAAAIWLAIFTGATLALR